MLDVTKMVDAVLDVVDKPLRAFHERIAAVEARTPERGEKGEPGLIGPRGEKGEPGLIGPRGEKGDRGDPGRDADMMVPPGLADRVASAVRLLHEAPPLIEPAPATAKVIRIERDGNGALVPVYE